MGSEWSLSICTSNMFLGDAADAGLETTGLDPSFSSAVGQQKQIFDLPLLSCVGTVSIFIQHPCFMSQEHQL